MRCMEDLIGNIQLCMKGGTVSHFVYVNVRTPQYIGYFVDLHNVKDDV
jgi:hypothetical protein